VIQNLRREIEDAFQRAELRSTPQRYAVLSYLLSNHEHPTADQIYRAINGSDPRASRATVYNNLHALITAGIVREVVLEAGPVRYDANIQRHHHFLCERCGNLDDIPHSDVPELGKRTRIGQRHVRDYEIVFRGFCERCSVGQAPRPARHK
jgi:Fe2+ or Zn2+ uptake regulation protein